MGALAAIAAQPRWEPEPACASADPRVFFPEDTDGNPVEDGPEADTARRICAQCPLREQCLQWALSAGMPVGIWGGHSTRERDGIRGLSERRGAA